MEACAVNWLSHSSGENSPLVHTLVVWGLLFGSECTISYTMLNLVKTPPASFRDIRPDLRERLRSTSAELDQLRAITENLEKTIQVLEQMLAEEERRFAPAAKKGSPEEPWPEFVMQSLRSGLRTTDDLGGWVGCSLPRTPPRSPSPGIRAAAHSGSKRGAPLTAFVPR